MHKTLFLRIMCTMKKALTTVHTILVIIILLATAGWSGFYLFKERKFNTDLVAKQIPEIASDISRFLDQNDTLYNNDFSDKIKEIFSKNSELMAVAIYSYDTGIEYFYSRNNQIKVNSEKDKTLDDPTPVYKGLGFQHSLGSIPLNIADKTGANIDCVYTVLPRGTIFYVLKISLIVVIALFFLTLLLIVIFSLSSSREKDFSEEENDWDQDVQNENSDELDMDEELQNSESSDLDFTDELPGNDSFADDSSAFDLHDESESPLTDMDDNFGMLEEESLDLDDLNLEDSIPDIPDTEDLLEMDHQEATITDFDNSDVSEDMDDFDLPEDEGFDELPDLDFDDSLDDHSEPADSEKDSHESQPSLYNPDSGLGWEHFLEERLSLELERAASFDQDLVLVILRYSGTGDNQFDTFTNKVKEKYSYSDLVFEAGEKEMAIIDPNKDLDASIKDIQAFLKGLEDSLDGSNISAGLSSRNGRLISGNRLIREATTSLNKTDFENPIVGFRSDPERFREFLGKNN